MKIVFALLLQLFALTTFSQSKIQNNSILIGEYRYTCGISCYETISFDGDHTYEYSIWGDSLKVKGEYSIVDNKLKLTPVKFNTESKKITSMDFKRDSNGLITLSRKERVSLFRKRNIIYVKGN